MYFFFSSRKNKQFEMTGAELADNLGLLSQMRRMKTSCLAMWYMTNEIFYQEALVVVLKAMKKLKKILKRGQCRYSKGGNLHQAILDFENILPNYKMTKLQIELQMHPSRADDIIDKMLDLITAQEPVNMKYITVRNN